MRLPAFNLCARFYAWPALGLLWFVTSPFDVNAQAAEKIGEQIYRKQCATCHGAKGEGTDDDYPHPLAGDKSVAQLKALIAKTMPKNAKVKCAAEDSEKVSQYIYDAFYSQIAQARNKPARVELS